MSSINQEVYQFLGTVVYCGPTCVRCDQTINIASFTQRCLLYHVQQSHAKGFPIPPAMQRKLLNAITKNVTGNNNQDATVCADCRGYPVD